MLGGVGRRIARMLGGACRRIARMSGGGGPTHREDVGGSGPTHREDAAQGGSATVREDVGDARPPHPQPGSLQLPGELGDRYRVVRQSTQAGAEGTLFDVVEIDTGAARVLKLYHGHVSLRAEALRRIQAVEAAHVVELIEFGQLTDGRWYEIQERIDGGDLVAYRSRMGGSLTPDQLRDAVSELSNAIAAFHEAGLAHHDIKPENVLVRTFDPLDLVLSDFGLAVVAGNRTYYATNRNATIAYQAPETMRQVGGEPRDYWALGLTIAMLATGDVPYAGINDHGILDQHHNRVPPPIVESMASGRIRQLCRGLTPVQPRGALVEPRGQRLAERRRPRRRPGRHFGAGGREPGRAVQPGDVLGRERPRRRDGEVLVADGTDHRSRQPESPVHGRADPGDGFGVLGPACRPVGRQTPRARRDRRRRCRIGADAGSVPGKRSSGGDG